MYHISKFFFQMALFHGHSELSKPFISLYWPQQNMLTPSGNTSKYAKASISAIHFIKSLQLNLDYELLQHLAKLVKSLVASNSDSISAFQTFFFKQSEMIDSTNAQSQTSLLSIQNIIVIFLKVVAIVENFKAVYYFYESLRSLFF